MNCPAHDDWAFIRSFTEFFSVITSYSIHYTKLYDWVATTTPTTPPWVGVAEAVDPIDGYKWELYNVKEDFSEANNLADKYPDKLREMQRLFYIEAVKFNVLPLDNTKVA